MNILGAVLNNFWAKGISLILAVATWFYVFDIVTSVDNPQKKDEVGRFFSGGKFMVREIPIKPMLSGRLQSGYKVDLEKVVVVPKTISMLLPESLAYSVKELKTEPVDLGEYTKPANLRLKVFSDSNLLRMDRKLVDVFIPVEKEGELPASAEKTQVEAVK